MNDLASDTIFVIEFLIERHRAPHELNSMEVARAVAIAKALSPACDEIELSRAVELVLETSGAALFDRRNRGKRDQIIRGVLR